MSELPLGDLRSLYRYMQSPDATLPVGRSFPSLLVHFTSSWSTTVAVVHAKETDKKLRASNQLKSPG